MGVGSISQSTGSGAMKAMTEYMQRQVDSAVSGSGQGARAQAAAKVADRSAAEQAAAAKLLAGRS